jgi:hypothetical protein
MEISGGIESPVAWLGCDGLNQIRLVVYEDHASANDKRLG